MRKILQVVSIVCVCLLSILFGLTYLINESNAKKIERYALRYIQAEFESTKKEYEENKIVDLVFDRLSQHDSSLRSKLIVADSVVSSTLEQLAQGKESDPHHHWNLPKIKASEYFWGKSLNEMLEPSYLEDYVRGTYHQTLREIPKEIRIFLICNILLFGLIWLIVWYKKLPDWAVSLPLALLCISTFLSMYLYLFKTNWLLKIVFGSYAGYSYLSLVFLIYIAAMVLVTRHYTPRRDG